VTFRIGSPTAASRQGPWPRPYGVSWRSRGAGRCAAGIVVRDEADRRLCDAKDHLLGEFGDPLQHRFHRRVREGQFAERANASRASMRAVGVLFCAH
jgi:hypothetical protein